MRFRLLVLVVLIVFLAMGLSFRLRSLNTSFVGDESFHVVAAKEGGKGHRSRLGLESVPGRAKLQTYVVVGA